MRQHAIPQNILDIEFKLFTKFTVREFVYMAVGIGFGGIFLYFFTKGSIPGIIAIPVFLASSSIGLVLGLVDINDQKSDVYFRNFFWAITHPTQRVWKNEMIDNKLGQLKPNLDITQGTTNRDVNGKPEEVNIIGGSSDAPKTQFIEQSKIDDLDREEAERLKEINQAATAANMNTTTANGQQTLPQQQVVNTNQVTQQPLTNNIPTQPVQPMQQVNNVLSQQIPTTQSQQTTPTLTQTPPTNIKIDFNNIESYTATLVKQPPYQGNLNFKVVKKDNSPIPQALLVLRDMQGRVVSALQSDINGEIISNKVYPLTTYNLQFQVNGYTFPNYVLVLDWNDVKPIKIVSN